MGTSQRDEFLVDGDWLESHLDDPSIRIVEVSDFNEKEEAYFKQGHIPGAVYWPWKDVLWHPTNREFTPPKNFAELMSKFGATPETTLVLYGGSLQYATYANWVCHMRSHRKIKILNGSRPLWIKQGRPMTKEVPKPAQTNYPVPLIDDTPRIGRSGVLAGLNDPDRVLLDLRTPEEYSGERVSPGDWAVDHGAERHGRIPGARHLYFEELLDRDMRFLSNEEMRASFEKRGAYPDDEIVLYCRLSHRGTLAWTVLTKFLGYKNVRVYDGSWTEWGSMVGMPVEP